MEPAIRDPFLAAGGSRAPVAPVAARPPQRGDVVSCYFPHDERPNRPGVKARPCLVLQVRRAAAPPRWHLQLAYGTTQQPAAARRGELPLLAAASLAAAGLRYPTRFDLRRTRLVPFVFPWFRANRAGAVVLRRLSAEDLARAEAALATIRLRDLRRRAPALA